MNQCRFSIITVCYNAEQTIANTIRSLLEQTYTDYEYIIKDGKSTDGTVEVARQLCDGNSKVKIISVQDDGIYDAMNQAVQQASGEYIFFLNSGDLFCNEKVLCNVNQFIQKQEAQIYYGNVIEQDEDNRSVRVFNKYSCSKLNYLLGSCICHQAIFAKRSLFVNKPFDLNYQVCADREWQLYYLKSEAKFLSMNFEVAEVQVDGFSRQHISEFVDETKRCLRLYFPKQHFIYCFLIFMKGNKVLQRVITKFDRTVSTRSCKDAEKS